LNALSQDLAANDFFLNPMTGLPESCPTSSKCLGSDFMPMPKAGYWVNWDQSNDAGIMSVLMFIFISQYLEH
jgi:hypothetical protein